VRELQNIIERAMVLTKGPLLELAPDASLAAAEGARATPRRGPATEPAASLDDVRRLHILSALERCDWVIEGPRGAAALLGLQPSTLRSRLKKLGLQQRPLRATN
jgi:transcriptional regulator with GAF, ATPase, and Fis domain